MNNKSPTTASAQYSILPLWDMQKTAAMNIAAILSVGRLTSTLPKRTAGTLTRFFVTGVCAPSLRRVR